MNITEPSSQQLVKQPTTINKYRTKGHEATLKIKEFNLHIDMMRKRYQCLQVKDDENRSKTIQHSRKIETIEFRREQIKKQHAKLLQKSRLQLYDVQHKRERNKSLKEEIQKRVTISKEKLNAEKEEQFKSGKSAHEKNEEKIQTFRRRDKVEQQERRKSVTVMEEQSRANISKFKEAKLKESKQAKQSRYADLMSVAAVKQKQLEKLSKLQEKMIQKNSQSLQISQVMKTRLREVLGDERRFTRLPTISLKNESTRTNTGKTSAIL